MNRVGLVGLVVGFALSATALPAVPLQPPKPGADVLELVRHYRELGVQGRYDEQASMWEAHAFNNGRTNVTPAMIKATLEDIYRTFPDYRSEWIETAVAGDTVITLSRVTGTHTGVALTAFNGGLLKGAKPTGKKFEVLQTHWWKVRAGKIYWHQGVRDDLGMMRQLGLVPQELPNDLRVP